MTYRLPPLLLGLALLVLAATAPAQPARTAPVLEGAERLGSGPVTAWRKEGHTLLELPAAALGRPLIWYTEIVSVPAGTVANDGLEINNTMARLERQGGAVHVRDLGTVQRRRAAPAPGEPAGVPGARPGDAKLRPVESALASGEVGALIASFPIVEARPDGTLVVDATATFGNDIPAATARLYLARAGLAPVAVDPARSYVEAVRVRPQALNIRSHLTWYVGLPQAAVVGPQPVSIVLGHSLVFLPERPMRGRAADPRVGFMPIEYIEFEPARGTAQEKQMLIPRFRLEKKNPAAAVSDPVQPIVFHLGRGIPERWKPYIRAGVLQWLPAFEAAGFSNALEVRDAPTPEQDPLWSAEDVTINVIRWLPQERVNAMGPHVSDPRSGETLSAHIQVWPQVLDGFGMYYWGLFGTVDPEAPRLPLSEAKTGSMLSYVVAHEVGHTLGLMHNHMASTAYPVAQMRDPAFANRYGPNSSIMAYGRFNQVAQPGDGVRQFWSVIGPYDLAAIRYGYGVFGTDAASEARELRAFAETFSADRRLFWATEESGEWIGRFGRDPRVLTENTGAERVLATKLGVANLLRSLSRLDAGTGGDPALYAATYDTMLARHAALLQSVPRLVGGVLPPLGAGEGPTVRVVPATEQREAVAWLLGEGARSLEPYGDPAVVERVTPYGGLRAVDGVQASLVGTLMNGPTVAALESQRRRDPRAYSSLDLGRDLLAAVWGEGRAASPTQRALQRGFVGSARALLAAWATQGADEPARTAAELAQGVPPAAARLRAETGDDTLFAAWLRDQLGPLATKLRSAARRSGDEAQRLHLEDMATQLAALAATAPR